MARGYKRLTRKARHLIRHLKRTKHASVQDQMIHELKHEVSRTHGFRGPKKGPRPGDAGHWRPLTRKGKQILTRLRKAKVWSVQKQLVNELAKEIERGRRAVDRARQAALRARARAAAAGRRVRAGAKRTGRGAVRFRKTVNRRQERLLTRAERRQAERGPRKPGRVRSRVQSWQRTRQRRPRTRQLNGGRWTPVRGRGSRPPKTLRDPGWERSRYNPQSPRYRPLTERMRNRGRGPRPVPARRRTPRPARTR